MPKSAGIWLDKNEEVIYNIKVELVRNSIPVPSKVKTIHWNAFGGCSALAEVTLPDGITTIEGEAFRGCSQLRYIKIPNSVTEIGYYAFYGCKNLTILFEGTKEEWDKIEKEAEWNANAEYVIQYSK